MKEFIKANPTQEGLEMVKSAYLCSKKSRRWGREKTLTKRAQKLDEKNEIQPKKEIRGLGGEK